MNPEPNEVERLAEKLLRTFSLEELLEQANVDPVDALVVLFEAGLLDDLPDELEPV